MSLRHTAGRNLTVAALLVAAAGFAVQMAAGVTDTQAIPPGLVAIPAAAAVVALPPGRGRRRAAEGTSGCSSHRPRRAAPGASATSPTARLADRRYTPHAE